MTDFDKFRASYEHHRAALAKANEHNKTAVFDALAAAGVTTITAEFDGEGDQGQIDAVIACAGEVHVTLPPTPVALQRAYWGKDSASTSETTLSEAIETLCYDYLEQKHGGWENNEGGFGSFAFDVVRRTIELEFNGRYTDIATHVYNL